MIDIYGASGHAKVIIEIIQSAKLEEIENIFDDNTKIEEILGYKVKQYIQEEKPKNTLVIAIGHNATRKRIAASLQGPFEDFLSHSSAIVSPSAKIGKGTVVMANASINAGAIIGMHSIINTGAVIEHEVVLRDFVHISPNVGIAGNVEIGEGTHIGIGASVIPGISIGKWAVIGAGAVIIENIPDFAVVVGNPGKIIKHNSDKNEQR